MDEHQAVSYFREILIILAIAGVAVPLLCRLKISPVLSYLLAGVLVGPYGLGLLASQSKLATYLAITDLVWVQGMAEFGIMLLLFTIGLEFSFSRLWSMRKLVVGLGVLQIVLTTSFISGIAIYFGNSPQTAILIGASLALSSTAIVIQLLKGQQRFSTPVGTVCFSILLMQDLAVVPILILLTVFSTNGEASITLEIVKALGKGVVAVGLIYIFGRLLLRPVFKFLGVSHNSEWFTAVILFIVVGAAFLTNISGLSLALGAFLAGLLLSETEFRHEVETVIDPLKGLFLGIFFMSVGMFIDLREVLTQPVWLAISVLGITTIKATIIIFLCKLFRFGWPVAIETGLLLGQGGEFAFMIVGMAMNNGIISSPHGQFFMLLAACSMLATPLIANIGKRLAHNIHTQNDKSALSCESKEKSYDNHIVIAGFGRVGRLIGKILDSQGIAYIAIDNDSHCVTSWRDKNLPVYFGDARRINLWEKLCVDQARAVLITIDDAQSAKAILEILRKRWPSLTIIARARDARDVTRLYDSGASLVVQETLEASLQIARYMLLELKLPEEEIDDIIDQSRESQFT